MYERLLTNDIWRRVFKEIGLNLRENGIMKDILSKIKPWTQFTPIVVFFLVLPFVWDTTNMLDASMLPRQLLLSIFLIVMSAVFVVLFFKGQRFSFVGKYEKFVFGGLALFMLMHIVSSAFGVDNGYEAFFRTVKEYGFCMFFVFVYQLIVNNYRGRELILKIMLVTGSIFITIGIIQFFKTDFSKFTESTKNLSYYLNSIIEEIYSTCSNKNLFSSILFVTLSVSVYCALSRNGNHKGLSVVWRIFAGIVTIADLTLIVIMLTRTVWAAVVLASVTAYILVYVRRMIFVPQTNGVKPALKTKLIYIGVPVVLVAAIVAVVALSDTQIERAIVERAALTFNPEKYGYKDNEHGESSVAMRKLIWEKTVDMIKDHPVLGVGPGQWQIEIPKYGVDEFGAQLREGSLTFQRPHNDYLWFASEVGLVGLLGYLIFYVGIIIAGLSNIRRSSVEGVALFNIVAVAALVGWVVISLVDYPHERIEHNVFYLTISAIVLADYTWRKNPENQTVRKGGAIVTLAVLVFGFVLGCLHLWQTKAYYNGEKNFRNVLEAYYNEDWDAVVQLTLKVNTQMYTLDNYTVPIHYYKGVALSYKNNDEAAIREFEQALKKHPYHLLTYCAMGTSLMKLEQYDEARDYFERALKISPRNNHALFDLAIVYYNQKEFKQALDYILRLPLAMNPAPQNFEVTRRIICRAAVNEDASFYNNKRMQEWMNDDDKVDSSIKNYYADSCSFKELLIKELGPNDQ